MNAPEWVDSGSLSFEYHIARIIQCSRCWRMVHSDHAIQYTDKSGNRHFACPHHEFDQEVLLD